MKYICWCWKVKETKIWPEQKYGNLCIACAVVMHGATKHAWCKKKHAWCNKTSIVYNLQPSLCSIPSTQLVLYSFNPACALFLQPNLCSILSAQGFVRIQHEIELLEYDTRLFSERTKVCGTPFLISRYAIPLDGNTLCLFASTFT